MVSNGLPKLLTIGALNWGVLCLFWKENKIHTGRINIEWKYSQSSIFCWVISLDWFVMTFLLSLTS